MKINIKNMFNFKLYLDALKQLRLMGFVCFGILVISALLMPIGTAIDIGNSAATSVTPSVITSFRAGWNMYLIFSIFTPLLTIYLFSFLTRRNACDYFHSFPGKRGCLYNTYFAAIATWICMFTFGTALITSITYGILSKYFAFSYLNFFKFSIAIFVCSMLVAAAICLACSITGTIFSNIIATGIIIFLPRLIVLILLNIVMSNLHMLVPGRVIPLLDYNYNLIFNSLTPMFSNSYSNLYGLNSIIYTAVLAIIYIVIGRLLFIRRRSEIAGNPSANRFLQSILRLCVALPICLMPVSTIFGYAIGKGNLTNLDVFGVFVEYLIAVIVLLLYELISTKKIKNVFRALPSVGILALLNVFIILSLVGFYESQLNFKPEAADVQFITAGSGKNATYLDYFQYTISSQQITNQELIQLFVDNLAKNIEYEKTAYPDGIKTSSFSNNFDYDDTPGQTNSTFVVVGFKCGYTMKYRYIYLDADAYKKYQTLLFDSENIKKFYLTFPNYDKDLMSFLGFNNFTDKEYEELYNSLKDEVKNLDYNKWYSLLNENRVGDGMENRFLWIYNVNEIKVATTLPLTSYTPKSLLKYVNFCNAETDFKKLEEEFKNIIDKNPDYFEISIQPIKSDTMKIDGISTIYGKEEVDSNVDFAKRIYNILNFDKVENIDSLTRSNQTLVHIYVYATYPNNNGTSGSSGTQYLFYTYIDNDILEGLSK